MLLKDYESDNSVKESAFLKQFLKQVNIFLLGLQLTKVKEDFFFWKKVLNIAKLS